ncbi:MAG: hypothetical protein ACYC4S_10900 [Rhodoferax sp.]
MTSPIKDVLKTLYQQAEVIEQTRRDGIVVSGQDASEAAIAALRQANALRPAGEDGFRLHPKLRDFLNDHLQLFPAYQTLAEIGTRISQARQLWNDVDDLYRAKDMGAVDKIVETIESTVFDIADSVDRNLLYLQTLLSTRYGNVRTLEAKKSQNNFYQHETKILALDMARMAGVFERIEQDATVRGMLDLAKFIRVNLQAHLQTWQNSMSEMQAHLSREIFRLREVERSHKQLARLDMLMRQQPSWTGFELDMSAALPDFLMAARLPEFLPNIEPLDSDAQYIDAMVKEVATLPPKPVDAAPKEVRRTKRIVDAPQVKKKSDAAIALERLVAAAQHASERFSVAHWRETDDLAQTMQAHVWLVFAVMALRGRKFQVEVVTSPARIGERFRHLFHDAMVIPAGVSA